MGSGISSSQYELTKQHFLYSLRIGGGGFSNVHSAMHIQTKKWYAIKEISLKDAMRQKNGLFMIQNELKIMKTIGSNSSFTKLHYAFRDMKTCYLVFDLLTGADLRYHLRKRHHFSEGGIAFLIGCLSSALHFLHSKGIIHRDVKPENILLDANGFPYLIDYGVSYMTPVPIEDGSSSPLPRLLCYESSGTRQYLSPEVFTRNHAHGIESDFWSLGVVMYELLFQKRPFEKHCPIEMIEFAEIAQSRGDLHSRTFEMKFGKATFGEINSKLWTNDTTLNTFAEKMLPLSPCSVTNATGTGTRTGIRTETPLSPSLPPLSHEVYKKQREQFISETLKQYCLEVEENPFSFHEPTNPNNFSPSPHASPSPHNLFPSTPISPQLTSKLVTLAAMGTEKCTCGDQLYAEIFCQSSSHLHKPVSLPLHLTVPLPKISKIYGELTSSCLEVLNGFLDVRLWLRLGSGEINYQKLQQHQWFQTHSLQWIFQSSQSYHQRSQLRQRHQFYQQQFIPCQQEINYDLCNKFIREARDGCYPEEEQEQQLEQQGKDKNKKNLWTAAEIEEINAMLGRYFYISEDKMIPSRSAPPLAPSSPLVSSSLASSPGSLSTSLSSMKLFSMKKRNASGFDSSLESPLA
jgi:serine/threonine protein kinase